MLSGIIGTKRIAALRADFAELRTQVSDASGRIDTLAQSLNDQAVRHQQELVDARNRAASAENGLAALRSDYEALQEQARHMSEASERAHEALRDAGARIDHLEAERARLDLTLTKLERRLDMQAEDLRIMAARLIGRIGADQRPAAAD